jgi:hypothetical protein
MMVKETKVCTDEDSEVLSNTPLARSLTPLLSYKKKTTSSGNRPSWRAKQYPSKKKKTFQFFVCLVLQDGTKEFV